MALRCCPLYSEEHYQSMTTSLALGQPQNRVYYSFTQQVRQIGHGARATDAFDLQSAKSQPCLRLTALKS